jgi:aryl-alcohol dehydrogenase-like predicted oxidoreductase
MSRMMNYRMLGRSGLRVSELALGTMTFGEEWGWGASAAESRKMFDAFVARGGNFIDTANRYTEGTSEKIVGELVAEDRERFVVATKYTLKWRDGDPNAAGNHRKNLVQSVMQSLERLDVDYVDVLWLHAWDFLTPIDEVMRALDDLVRQGAVMYVGVSDTPAWIVSWGNVMADLKGWSPFVALQVEHSLVERTVERDLIPMAKAFGMAVTPWSPLGGGVLSGKYSRGNRPEAKSTRLAANSARLSERNLAIAEVVMNVADEIGCSASQVSIRWLLDQTHTSIPIIGGRTEAQITDSMNALDITLSADQRARLDAVSAIELGFPHQFLQQPNIRDMVTGAMDARIVKP